MSNPQVQKLVAIVLIMIAAILIVGVLGMWIMHSIAGSARGVVAPQSQLDQRRTRMKRVLIFSLVVMLASASVVATSGSAKPRTQTARVVIGEKGFTPDSVKLRRGVRTRLTFLRTTDATCAKEIVLPDFNIRRGLPLNQPVVITFTPKKRGAVTFACGMNMMRGQLIVQ